MNQPPKTTHRQTPLKEAKRARLKRFCCLFVVGLLGTLVMEGFLSSVNAAPVFQFDLSKPFELPQFSNSIQLFLFLSSISLIPFFVISTTSFIRIVVVFSILRTAIGTQQVPPSPAIIALAIFMTIFIMTPVWQHIQTEALEPYQRGAISQAKAFEEGLNPIRGFMFKQTRDSELALFIRFSKIPPPEQLAEVPTYVLIPAFMISELKTAFQIGFVLFIPFLVIDLVIANILLSLGMFMLSPVIVSLPFKILLFVLADGWTLITQGLMTSFQ